VHEYAHLIMRHAGVNYPRWLNEGLAEFFSTLSPQGGQMSLGRVPMGRLMELREGDRMLDLPRLFAVDHNSAEYNTRTHAGTFYAQSWALTHMLMTSDGYRQGVGRFLNAVAGGQPSATAIEQVYGRPLTQVFSDLAAYVRADRFAFFSAKYRDPRAESSFPVRTVEPFEIAVVTANLLADAPGRMDEARAAYDALLAERPTDADLLGARGYFELRRGDRVVAAEFLKRAVDAGSENAQTYRWAAMLASSQDERETLLGRAVQLDPGNVDVRLAYVGALVNQRKTEAAFDALVPVTRVTPEQAFAFFELKTLVALQLDHIDEAQKAASSARQYASPGPQTAAADRLVRSIAEFAARRAEVDRMVRETRTSADAGARTGPTPGSTVSDATAPLLPAPGGSLVAMATGRFRNLDCSGAAHVMEVVTDAGTLRLVIDDPLAIRIEGAGGPTIDLHCGAQDRAVQVGYLPGAQPSQKTAGQVRLIRFR
jgi:Tfp pilus assembly protein PilF